MVAAALLAASAQPIYGQTREMGIGGFQQPESKKIPRSALTVYTLYGVGQGISRQTMLGLGSRWRMGHSGVDIRFDCDITPIGIESDQLAPLPESATVNLSYLYFLDPAEENTIYFGLGGAATYLDAFGIVKDLGNITIHQVNFKGQVLVGYEFRRSQLIKPFVQLALSQEVAKVYWDSDFSPNIHLYPSCTLSAGVGF